MVRGMAILLLLQFVGEVISRSLGVPIPGNVIGMGLLLAHFALFFVPAGVGVMVYFDLIAKEWLAISVAMVVSTFAVMAATGWTEAWLEKRGRGHVE